MPQHSHIAVTSFRVRWAGRAPGTGQRVGAVRAGHGGQHAQEFGPQPRQPADFLLDLADVAAQQACGGFTRAHPGVADGEQVTDFRQPQPEPLRAPDEQQAV